MSTSISLKTAASGCSSANDQNGVLLVTGGHSGSGTGLYWQTVSNGTFGPITNEVTGLFTSGISNAHLHIVVAGNTYSVYVNGSTTPATTLTTSAFASGKVALYDNSSQTFSNVSLSPNSANIDLRDGSGKVYPLTPAAYAGGLSESIAINGAPLQPGNYTLTVYGATDRAQNPMTPFSLAFTVNGVAPFITESSNDNSLATATPLATPTSQADGSVTLAHTYPSSGTQLYYAASASLRGAGHPLDLVTANYGSGTISVALGNGDGTFQTPVTYTVGNNPIALAIGDLTGDGKLDIAVANYGSGTVSVLIGNGDGTFQTTAVTYSVGASPAASPSPIWTAKTATTSSSPTGIATTSACCWARATARLAAAVNYNVGNNPGNVLLADLNGDGKLDIVTPNYSDNTVSVLPGNGDGTFGTQVVYPTGSNSNPIDVVALDLNGDHKLDLATSNLRQ